MAWCSPRRTARCAKSRRCRTSCSRCSPRCPACSPATGAPGPARNSWRFGLERMLLGVALEEGVVFAGATPCETGGQDAIEEIGRLAHFIDRLAHYAAALAAPRAMDAWMALLRALIEDFYADTPESTADLAELHAAIAALTARLDEAGFQETLTREVLLDMLQEQLAAAEGSHQFLRGGINFCQLTPLRSIPFRVVCLLGMNAEAFPRNTQPPAFDLMAAEPRPGDPSRRDDDRYLFLEALLSARDCLYISYVARDERSNEQREPAVPVCELRDYIDRHWGATQDGAGAGAALTRSHRLKPFHAAYFEPGGALFSYRHEWLPAARAEAAPAPFCPEPLPACAIAELTLAELLRFFRNPCQEFFNTRLGVRFEEAEEMAADSEPFALDGLAAWALRDELLATALAGGDAEVCAARVAAAGTLPHGQAGQIALQAQQARSAALIATAGSWAALEPVSAEFALDIAGTRLHGTVANLRGGALRQLSASKANGATRLQFWIT
ncbi:MAG: exodeoxyribonuclease V subunit gamma, partial [Gammaproteobacteria bacterium]|nr:exodeoxyribonuclease V subunit gamma [Gammaproteobacteria bacterium]